MPMQHQLPCLAPASCKSQPVDYIVQAAFQQHKQIFTGNTRHPQSTLKEKGKLLFLHPVNSLKFLFSRN
jgi:hypothetical protein